MDIHKDSQIIVVVFRSGQILVYYYYYCTRDKEHKWWLWSVRSGEWRSLLYQNRLGPSLLGGQPW